MTQLCSQTPQIVLSLTTRLSPCGVHDINLQHASTEASSRARGRGILNLFKVENRFKRRQRFNSDPGGCRTGGLWCQWWKSVVGFDSGRSAYPRIYRTSPGRVRPALGKHTWSLFCLECHICSVRPETASWRLSSSGCLWYFTVHILYLFLLSSVRRLLDSLNLSVYGSGSSSPHPSPEASEETSHVSSCQDNLRKTSERSEK